MFVFQIDEQKKIVHVEVSGIVSVAEAEKLNQELLANASAARRKFGSFRLVVDARLSPVQPADTINSFKPPREILISEDDRYAVVVGSSLSKLQANRVLEDNRTRAFLSMNEAESWLFGCTPSPESEQGQRG